MSIPRQQNKIINNHPLLNTNTNDMNDNSDISEISLKSGSDFLINSGLNNNIPNQNKKNVVNNNYMEINFIKDNEGIVPKATQADDLNNSEDIANVECDSFKKVNDDEFKIKKSLTIISKYNNLDDSKRKQKNSKIMLNKGRKAINSSSKNLRKKKSSINNIDQIQDSKLKSKVVTNNTRYEFNININVSPNVSNISALPLSNVQNSANSVIRMNSIHNLSGDISNNNLNELNNNNLLTNRTDNQTENQDDIGIIYDNKKIVIKDNTNANIESQNSFKSSNKNSSFKNLSKNLIDQSKLNNNLNHTNNINNVNNSQGEPTENVKTLIDQIFNNFNNNANETKVNLFSGKQNISLNEDENNNGDDFDLDKKNLRSTHRSTNN